MSKMDDARYVEEHVKNRIVNDLASGRLRRFRRTSIESAVDALYECADSAEMVGELQDFQAHVR